MKDENVKVQMRKGIMDYCVLAILASGDSYAPAIIAELKRAEMIVVGHPRNMDGSRGEAARRAEDLAAKLGEMTGLPVQLWDERMTTVSAIG